MPLVATAVYALAKPLGFDRVPVNTIVFYWTTLGTALFVVAVVRGWIRPSSEPGASSSGGACLQSQTTAEPACGKPDDRRADSHLGHSGEAG
jgi:hypothetical protein